MRGEFWLGFICNMLYFTIISTIMIALATFAVLLWVALVFKIMPWQMAITKAAIQSQASTALWEQKFARFIHASTAPLLNFRHRFNFGPSILIMPMTSKLRTQTRWTQMYREPTTYQRHWGVSYTTVRKLLSTESWGRAWKGGAPQAGVCEVNIDGLPRCSLFGMKSSMGAECYWCESTRGPLERESRHGFCVQKQPYAQLCKLQPCGLLSSI